MRPLTAWLFFISAVFVAGLTKLHDASRIALTLAALAASAYLLIKDPHP